MKKHYILLFSCLFWAAAASAQSSKKPKEIGFQVSGFDTEFSGIYKVQKSENVFRRYRFLAGNIGVFFVDEPFLVAGVGLAIGRENRRYLDTKLMFYRGPEFNLNLAGVSFDTDQVFAGSVGLGYILGLQHNFNDYWAVNIETIPGLSVSILDNEDVSGIGVNVGASNSVSIGVVRRF